MTAMFFRRAAGARVAARLTTLAFAVAGGTVLLPAGAHGASAPAAPDRGSFDEATAASLPIERARLKSLSGRPQQMGPLLALEEFADLVPPGALDADFRAVLADPNADPLVSARARGWLARRAEAQGDDHAAEELRRPLGLLSRFWVVGPFGDGRASYGVAFPPENATGAPDPTHVYPGKERDVAWRRADDGSYRGRMHLDALLRPDSDAAAYLLTFVRVPSPTDAALRLGTPGPVKVWCNGALAHAADRARTARFDQDAVGIRLHAGWNRIAIKTVVTQGSWQVYARLTRPDGTPLAFETALAPAGPLAVTARAPAVAVRDLEAILRARAGRGGTAEARAEAWLDLGRYLLAVDPSDRDARAPAQAFEASARERPGVAALMGLAAAAREGDERRRALARALPVAATPGERARVLAAQGDVARDKHRESAAEDDRRAALAVSPGFWPAALALASQEQTAGVPAAALGRMQALSLSVCVLLV